MKNKSLRFGTAIFIYSAVLLSCQSTNSKDADVNRDSTVVSEVHVINPDSIIVPGVSAGKVKLGQNADSVYEAFGKPDAGDAAMQKAVAIWYYQHQNKSKSFAIYTARTTGENPPALIKQIRLTYPNFKTKNGIGVSSELPDIKKWYRVREVQNYKKEGLTANIYDSTEGIAFEMDQQGKCIAILLHPKDEAIKATYLPLRE